MNLDKFEADASKIYNEALAVLVKKQMDYGPKNIADAPGGPLNGLRVRMHDKMSRINHLIDNGADPENEALIDSFLDMMNYAAIGQMVLLGKWSGTKEGGSKSSHCKCGKK
jgi:hypothetical protein